MGAMIESTDRRIGELLRYFLRSATLRDAVEKAEKQAPGFRAVSVEPKSNANFLVAVVTLVKGAQFKSVTEPLE
jgi:hypothetical protein